MSIDPLTEAAREIAASPHYLDADEVRAVIVTHLGTRFDPNVAYMPVPRCGTCGHWDNSGRHDDKGGCDQPWVMAIVPKNFGCIAHKSVV